MLGGLTTLFTTVVGLFRFQYVLNRIHVAAKCDTFGVLLIFSSLIMLTGWSVESLKLLLIKVFICNANPVSGHLISHLEVATNPRIKDECEIISNDAD
jgi:multicomponent Na+:H+ antiporter subunit G